MQQLLKLRVVFVPLVVLALFIPVPAPCSGSEPENQAAAQAVNAFAIALYGQIRKPEGNLIFSPFSISMCSAMAYAGARGRTESQMAKAMRFRFEPSEVSQVFGLLSSQILAAGKGKTIEINIANALWAEQSQPFLKQFLEAAQIGTVQSGWSSWVPFLDGFLELIGTKDQGGLRHVDFRHRADSARKTINGWVEKQTKSKIRDLLAPGTITNDTKLVLTNAIYFKGTWVSEFDKKRTKKDSFTLLNDERVKVPMMNQTESFGYAEDAGLQVLEMPYKGEQLSMVVLLPSKQERFEDFDRSITIEKLGQWMRTLRIRRVEVHMPKFKMESAFPLKTSLVNLGMIDAFAPTGADFSGMTGHKDLFIHDGVHKAFVDVNEEGTEAAAATGWYKQTTGRPAPTPVFRADHPFLFLIRHKPSNCILFLGRVTNP